MPLLEKKKGVIMKNGTKNILRSAGFTEEVKAVECGICPLCSNPISGEEFEDKASLKEFEISGMCQACQNKMFI